MLIDCPGCGKSYHIIKAALGPTGRRVACPRCDAIWFVPVGESCEGGTPMAGIDQVSAPAAEISAAATSEESNLTELAGVLPSPADFPPVRFSSREAEPTASRRRRPLLPTEFLASMALLAFAMALIGFRSEIVRLWPRAETAYAALGLPVNLRGLALQNFHSLVTNDGFQTTLGVEGEIANLRPQSTKIPPIALAICDKRGHALYSWVVTPRKTRLGANETLAFRARLAAPPPTGHDVLIRFAPSQALASAAP